MTQPRIRRLPEPHTGAAHNYTGRVGHTVEKPETALSKVVVGHEVRRDRCLGCGWSVL